MQLGNQGTAFLPDGGTLPGGPYPVYVSLDVTADGLVTGDVYFLCEPNYARPISIGREFDLHVPHPDSILGDSLVFRIKFVGDSGSVSGYAHGSRAQFHPHAGDTSSASSSKTQVQPAATAEPSPPGREQVPLPQNRDRVADKRTRKIRDLWEGFGTVAKDARIKVVAYPLVVVLGAVLVLVGNSAYERLFGDIYLTVYVNDEDGKPLEGAVVGTSQTDGPYVSARTDLTGIASLTLKHGNMEPSPTWGWS